MSDRDMVLARQRAGEIAGLMGLDSHEQTRISTAVSEAVRDCLKLGGLDEIAFYGRETDKGSQFEIEIRSSRIDPATIASSMSSVDRAEDNLASGLIAARRLMDDFGAEAHDRGGSIIILGRNLPHGTRVSSPHAKSIADRLSGREPRDAMEEVRRQNQELVTVLDEVRKRQEDLIELNRELEDTNRGVLALHAELEQRSEQLRKANELKTRFISEMSHEFRTPINSILALCQILMAGMDGDLTAEQEKQVGFISKSAEGLSDLVNDLLDLAKIEAGRIDVNVEECDIGDLFGSLKGVMKPLVTTDAVRLVFEDVSGLPKIFTDEAKVGQLLRNLISNAIKFTEEGEVRVSAALDEGQRAILFSVVDTGIGMSPQEQDIIFHEFMQLRSPIQKKVKGTGLGLPLSRKLAELLGGSITCKSRSGEGSTFLATIPVCYEEGMADRMKADSGKLQEPEKPVVLVIEDDPNSVYTYRKFLQDTPFEVMDASSLSGAREILSRIRPSAIVLDILLHGESGGWEFLAELKGNEATKDIPVLVVTVLEDRKKGMLLGAHDFCVKPIERTELLKKINTVPGAKKILVIDDEEVSRYILKGLLAGTFYEIVEADSGEEGLSRALSEQPDLITLDLVMPGMTGFEVLERLKADARTQDIPVIIVTSKRLDDEERKDLMKSAAGVLSKHASSREQTIRQLRILLEQIAVG